MNAVLFQSISLMEPNSSCIAQHTCCKQPTSSVQQQQPPIISHITAWGYTAHDSVNPTLKNGVKGLLTSLWNSTVWRVIIAFINSLWPSDVIRRQGTESTLTQVMACCLTTPSHYLNQCWLIISKILWQSSDGIIMSRSEDTNQWNKIENYILRIVFRSPRPQWVNALPSIQHQNSITNNAKFTFNNTQWNDIK